MKKEAAIRKIVRQEILEQLVRLRVYVSTSLDDYATAKEYSNLNGVSMFLKEDILSNLCELLERMLALNLKANCAPLKIRVLLKLGNGDYFSSELIKAETSKHIWSAIKDIDWAVNLQLYHESEHQFEEFMASEECELVNPPSEYED